MKRLLLLRHAKSDWGKSQLDDFDRELAPRGLKAAPRVGKWLADNGLSPDLVLVSSARRAQQTWELVAPLAGRRAEVRHDRALYLATPGEVLAHLAAATADDAHAPDCVLMVGHNPGFETLAAMLAGPDSDPVAAANLSRGFPTAGLAVFEIDAASWSELAEAPIRLAAFVRPREL